MSLEQFSLRLAAAIVAGFIIGFERQWQYKTTGLRTHALVAVGAASYVLISVGLTGGGEGDVTRIIGQVVVGVGFLGGGVIMRDGLNVQGLNSAASIWCSSAIGCLAGAGFFPELAVATLAVVLINLGFRPVDEFLANRKNKKKDSK
ncbi:MAG: MgtC/SapB family protein [Saprospiraceae bacterium]